MISLFPAGEPLSISVDAGHSPDWKVGALLGFIWADGHLAGLAVNEEGEVGTLRPDEFTIDWRFEGDHWVDINAPRSAESDQDG